MEIASWINLVKIRPLVQTDLQALEWEGEFSHFRKIYADAYERAKSGRSVLWVAEIDPQIMGQSPQKNGRVVGQLFVQLTCDRPDLANGTTRAYIYAFRVRPVYRGSGLGTRMLSVAENDVLKRGFQTTTLNVAKNNYNARRLYERQGYRVVSADPGRWSYPDEKGAWHFVEEPAWRMEKKLR